MQQSLLKPAFTLVELIVVITILAILGTIGFVSLQGYSVSARDSVRIADTKTYIKELNIYQTKNGEVPLPDDMTTITGSGVVFSYQGTLSGSVITQLGQGQVPLDPLLGTPYLYATNEGRTKVQLLSYHEKNISSFELQNTLTYAETTYADMFPKVMGDEIGILLNADNTRVPSGSYDIDSLTGNEKLLFDNDSTITSQNDLQHILLAGNESSCLDVLTRIPDAESGVFYIYPRETRIQVYCDMLTNGGGWTLVYKTTDSENDLTGFMDESQGIPSWDSGEEYKLSIDFWKSFSTQDAMIRHVRIDGVEWEDTQVGYIEEITNQKVDFSERDNKHIFGYGTEDIAHTVLYGYYKSDSGGCSRCFNYTNEYHFGANHQPMVSRGRSSLDMDGVEGAGGTIDATWHVLSKMGLFLR